MLKDILADNITVLTKVESWQKAIELLLPLYWKKIK